MKHHCHCGLKSQIKKFKAGKLGVFGGILIIGHLLFHVVECLALPTILMALHGNAAEATTSQVVDTEIIIDTTIQNYLNFTDLNLSFQETIDAYGIASDNQASLDKFNP